MNAIDIIKRLQETSSRNEKEEILNEAWHSGNRDFFMGAKLAYDPMITFGIAKIAELVENDGQIGIFSFTDFLELVGKLKRRELTGNAARDAINNSALNSDFEEWNLFFRRILLKDLRIGLEEKTINKVLKTISKTDASAKDYMIQIFSCQLAEPAKNNPKKMKNEKIIQIKLDGVRLLTVLNKENNTVIQYTRNGIVNNNFTELTNGFQKLLKDIPVSIVLDGEVLSKNFQELMTQVNRKENVDTSDAHLALFDIIPLNDFEAGICKICQKDRIKSLIELAPYLQEYTNSKVYIVPSMTINLDTPEGKEAMRKFNIETLAAGYEGIMIKDPLAPYETKRTASWLKIKPIITVDLEIVGVEEGTGKYVGNCGALVLEGEDSGYKIRTNVGSGLTDEQRADIWANQQNVLGRIVEVEADAITKDRKEDEWYSLRFPRNPKFRGTVPGEKL